MPIDIYSLDIETSSKDKNNPQYALEPYRRGMNLAKIDSIAVSGPDGYLVQLYGEYLKDTKDLLHSLKGKIVYAHNAIFDVAWLLYDFDLYYMNQIKWRDTLLLAKWVLNGQATQYMTGGKFSFALANLVDKFIPDDHPLKADFLKLKDQTVVAGEDFSYWLERGRKDAILTRDLAIILQGLLPIIQRRGFIDEQRCISTVANSWNEGILLNKEKAMDLQPKIKKAKAHIASLIGKPEPVMTSTKQLGNFLFNELGLKAISFGKPNKKTGIRAPSTCKDDLLMLATRHAGSHAGNMLKHVLDFKQLATLESKFIKGIVKCCAYNSDSKSHSSPKMFGTYTGRFTYAAKTQKKWASGIATHQLPRKGPTRGLLIGPDGRPLGELDAAAQEMRFIGEESLDAAIIAEFNNGIDLHSSMASYISGDPYETFQKLYHSGDAEAVNFRYAGKLLNLSCQYRIGWKSLKSKFFTTYGINISQQLAMQYLSMYKRRYPGVVQYWDTAIQKGITNGFAESIGRRRYYLTEWQSKRWQTESSAINFPVQGAGADHKCVAISRITPAFPEVNFILDLHDGIFYVLPHENPRECLLDMRAHLNALDWQEIWDRETHLPFPFDASLSDLDNPAIGNVRELE